MVPDPRRRDDIVLAQVSQKLDDFMDRYERDWIHTQSWRDFHDKKIEDYGLLLNEIAPNYRRGVWVLTTIIITSIGIIVKMVWSHVSFR